MSTHGPCLQWGMPVGARVELTSEARTWIANVLCTVVSCCSNMRHIIEREGLIKRRARLSLALPRLSILDQTSEASIFRRRRPPKETAVVPGSHLQAFEFPLQQKWPDGKKIAGWPPTDSGSSCDAADIHFFAGDAREAPSTSGRGCLPVSPLFCLDSTRRLHGSQTWSAYACLPVYHEGICRVSNVTQDYWRGYWRTYASLA